MDGRPKHRNKAVFSNFPSVMYTGPKYIVYRKKTAIIITH